MRKKDNLLKVAQSSRSPRLLSQMTDEAIPLNDLYTLVELSLNPLTPPDALRKMYQKYGHEHYSPVVENISENPNTPLDVLKDLSKSVYYVICILRNPSLPPPLIEQIYTVHGNAWGCAFFHISKHPNTLVKILDELSSHPQEEIRANVASNPSTQIETLLKLSFDDNAWVRNTAQDRLMKSIQ